MKLFKMKSICHIYINKNILSLVGAIADSLSSQKNNKKHIIWYILTAGYGAGIDPDP